MIYHKDVYMPIEVYNDFVFDGDWKLSYTKHANKSRFDDRYGEIPEYMSFNHQEWEVIEIYPLQNKLTVRKKIDENNDVVLVILWDNTKNLYRVLTTWINVNSDKHNTLKRWKYIQPKSKLIHKEGSIRPTRVF